MPNSPCKAENFSLGIEVPKLKKPSKEPLVPTEKVAGFFLQFKESLPKKLEIPEEKDLQKGLQSVPVPNFTKFNVEAHKKMVEKQEEERAQHNKKFVEAQRAAALKPVQQPVCASARTPWTPRVPAGLRIGTTKRRSRTKKR
ncbi:unnamed protein product [Amoebophrya sp. A120]|nr:unnamed protein product [Amoebophrya sp. A120]|eukprot:GSA120T00013179001.1